MKKIGKLCIITDTAIQKKYTHYEIANLAIKGGADMIQLRDKSLPTGELIEAAIKIRKLCNKHKVLFIVNDRVDVAMISDADGVHLGLKDISINDARKLLSKGKIIGGTAHSLKEAKDAEKNGADYIGFGHIYPTGSKLKTDKPKGTALLRKIVREIKTPIIAIGGISIQNARDVISTGVYGAAVIGSVVKSENPVKAVKELRKLFMAKKICVLTIAGSDSGAGAGIQSDLKTFKNHGLYGVTVITAITAQNTKGVQKTFELPTAIIAEQLKSIFNDFDIKFAKTGMLSSAKVIDVIVKHIRRRKNMKLVIDPVILPKKGRELLDKPGVKALREELIPLSYLITPNIHEAEMLTGVSIDSLDELETAAVILNEMGAKNVLIKGGHMKKSVGLPLGTDILFDGKRFYMFSTQFIKTNNTHGIGCTLSAAITSNLAIGNTLLHAIEESKNYVVKSLTKSVKIGKGTSPVEQ